MIEYTVSTLKKFDDERGSVLHGMKFNDEGSYGIKEVYFSTVKYGFYKGWKKHKEMILNLIVINGEIVFYLANNDFSKIINFSISHKDAKRLTVMPNQWLAFTSATKPSSTLINISNLMNNEDIVDNKPFFLP